MIFGTQKTLIVNKPGLIAAQIALVNNRVSLFDKCCTIPHVSLSHYAFKKITLRGRTTPLEGKIPLTPDSCPRPLWHCLGVVLFSKALTLSLASLLPVLLPAYHSITLKKKRQHPVKVHHHGSKKVQVSKNKYIMQQGLEGRCSKCMLLTQT